MSRAGRLNASAAGIAATVANDCHYLISTHIMLGRSVVATEEQLSHLGDDSLPKGIYSPAEAIIVRYAQQLTLRIQIDDAMFAESAKQFRRQPRLLSVLWSVKVTL